MELSERDKKLIAEAKQIAEFLTRQLKNENTSTVGAAIRMTNGKIYTGRPNIYHTKIDPNYICAERVTLSKAYADKLTDIDTIAAYRFWPNGDERIVPPCDKCKKFINLFGDPWVIIDHTTKLKLSEL